MFLIQLDLSLTFQTSSAKFFLLFLVFADHFGASSSTFQRRHQQRWRQHPIQHFPNGPQLHDDQSVEVPASSPSAGYRPRQWQYSHWKAGNGAPSPPNRGKMNAAGFFYISADFPLASSEERGEEGLPPPMMEDLANEDCSMYPNGTYKAPYAFTCSDPRNGPPLFVVHDTALANRSGHYEYPLDLTDAAPMLRVFMDLTSYATKSFESMRAEVALLRRKVGWLGCGWMPIPTFGAFDSIDICDENDSCPIFPGRQVLEIRLDPSSVFLAMLRLMLHDDKPPYELRIRLIDNRSHGEELLCVAFQSRLLF